MQLEHKTKKGTVLFIKLPDDAREIELLGVKTKVISCLSATRSPKWYSAVLPIGFQIIGFTSEITEEKAKMMVDMAYDGYSSLSSFKHIMQHLQVYEVNLYPKCECKIFSKEFEDCEHINSSLDSCFVFDKHQEAQSRTGKWLVLFKPEI